MADIYIGNVKGPQGETGATGAQGPQGDAATIEVGTVSTTAYGNTAQVINSGTSSEAVFDFVIPQGRPGEETTRMSALTLDTVTAQSAEFPIPATGESGATVFGKIIKFFNDAKTAINSKINISDIVNNLTSTATNKPLSAAQGKALNDALTSFALVDSRDMAADTARGVNSEIGYGDVTLSKGFYLLISETSVQANFNGRTFARFKSNNANVMGNNTFVPPTINGYGYLQLVQFVNVTSSANVGRYYYDTVQSASSHLWRVYKLFG